MLALGLYYLIFETNTCVSQLSLALSYGVFPAGNRCHSSWNLLISKIVVIPAEAGTTSARYILLGAVFHRDGLPLIEPQVLLNKPVFYLFCDTESHDKIKFPAKKQDRTRGEEKQTLLSKRREKLRSKLCQARFHIQLTLILCSKEEEVREWQQCNVDEATHQLQHVNDLR